MTWGTNKNKMWDAVSDLFFLNKPLCILSISVWFAQKWHENAQEHIRPSIAAYKSHQQLNLVKIAAWSK